MQSSLIGRRLMDGRVIVAVWGVRSEVVLLLEAPDGRIWPEYGAGVQLERSAATPDAKPIKTIPRSR